MTWQTRLFKVNVGLGTGPDAGTFETTIEGPEWMGQFGGLEADRERWIWQRDQILADLALRFPDEKLKLVSLTPLAGRVRPVWDRPGW